MSNSQPKRDTKPYQATDERSLRQSHTQQPLQTESLNLPRTVCPYLGSWDDPSTARSYVTDANYCYHVRPATMVKAEVQRTHCLTYHHTQCPIYRQEMEVVLPPRHLRHFRRARLVVPVLLVCMAFILAAVILASVVR